MPRGKAKGKDAGFAEDGEGGSSWLTTYADAITLLMAFFMMLYAMSQVDQIKFEALIAGFAVPFGNDSVGTRSGQDSLLDSGVGIVGGETARGQQSAQVVDPSDPFFETLQAPRVPDPQAAENRDTGAGTDVAGGLPELDIDQLQGVQERLEEALQIAGFAPDVTFELVERGLIVSIATDEVLFPLGSARFVTEGQAVLDVLAPVLAEFGNRVNVEGHTDNSPLNRGGYTNWNLSTDRAVAVVDYFASRFGMTPGRMAAVGYGEFAPKMPNDTRENRALNRRVEVVILAGGT